MADDKKYTPIEAAVAVLNKAKEMYKGSTLSKAITGHEKGVHRSIVPPGISDDKLQGTSPAGYSLKVGGPNSLATTEHKKVLAEMKQMPRPNLGKSEHQPHPGATSLVPGYGAAAQAQSETHLKSPQGDAERQAGNATRMKGHIKLAKFVGRMESKRGMAKTETGHEKGVAIKMNPNSKEGMSTAGANVRLGDESAAKKEAVGRMTDAEQIKPKLP